jgi:hypothetical protein
VDDLGLIHNSTMDHTTRNNAMCQEPDDLDDDDWDENEIDWDDEEEPPLSQSPSKLDRDSDPVEVTVAVTLRASLCDLDTEVNVLDLRHSVARAVENAVRHHEQVGFDHALADIVSLGLVEVRALNAE